MELAKHAEYTNQIYLPSGDWKVCRWSFITDALISWSWIFSINQSTILEKKNMFMLTKIVIGEKI